MLFIIFVQKFNESETGVKWQLIITVSLKKLSCRKQVALCSVLLTAE